MVEVDFSGNFLNADVCKANDVVVFVDEGELKPRSKGESTWNVLIITVEHEEKQYSHSFRSSEGKRFQDLHGKDTQKWIGKKGKVTLIPWVDKNDNNKIKHNVELIPVDEESPKEVASVQA